MVYKSYRVYWNNINFISQGPMRPTDIIVKGRTPEEAEKKAGRNLRARHMGGIVYEVRQTFDEAKGKGE